MCGPPHADADADTDADAHVHAHVHADVHVHVNDNVHVNANVNVNVRVRAHAHCARSPRAGVPSHLSAVTCGPKEGMAKPLRACRGPAGAHGWTFTSLTAARTSSSEGLSLPRDRPHAGKVTPSQVDLWAGGHLVEVRADPSVGRTPEDRGLRRRLCPRPDGLCSLALGSRRKEGPCDPSQREGPGFCSWPALAMARACRRLPRGLVCTREPQTP